MAECSAQDIKWGADRTHLDFVDFVGLDLRHRWYHIPSADDAQGFCDNAFQVGCGTWADILIEEVAEAVETENDTDLRSELVQVAAVAVQWIAAIDRRTA